MTRFYISGPITGVEGCEEKFEQAERKLRCLKHLQIINPAPVLRAMPKDTTWEKYMEVALCMLRDCDAVYMLRGWERSTGAQIERLYAIGSGRGIVYEDEMDEEKWSLLC